MQINLKNIIDNIDSKSNQLRQADDKNPHFKLASNAGKPLHL